MGTSECAYIVNSCGLGYLWLYENLAHVRVKSFIEQVSFRGGTLQFGHALRKNSFFRSKSDISVFSGPLTFSFKGKT